MLELEVPRTELEYTPEPVRDDLAYEGYRVFVDELDESYRLTGLVGPEGYRRATDANESRTIHARFAVDGVDSPMLPMMVPIEYVAGYDVDRSRSLAGTDDIAVLTLPFDALGDVGVQFGSDGGRAPGAILVETDHRRTAEAQRLLPSLLSKLGNYEPYEMLDHRIRDPERQTAQMAMYMGRFAAIDDQGRELPARGIGFGQAYQELLSSNSSLTEHTRLVTAAELSDDTVLAQKLSNLCRGRFDWLGENNPVSMEDTEEFFMQLLLDDSTHILVRYNDGEPVCMGFFASGLEGCEWMKQKYRDSETSIAADQNEQVMYFHGIASSSSSAARYSYDVVGLLTGICRNMGGVYRVYFESTGMSGGYIPRIVMGNVGDAVGMRVIEPVAKTAQLDYWLLKPVSAGVTS